MFTFLIALPWIVIIAAVLIGVTINIINHDHVFASKHEGK